MCDVTYLPTNVDYNMNSNMFEDLKFSDLEVISVLERTHLDTTIIYLVRLNEQVLVCKVILYLCRQLTSHISATLRSNNIYRMS
jgi:hypothetical protein